MFNSFRLTMTWLHTWFGLVLGFVLMVVFFFGSLSVFDREIDRWAQPETRYEPQVMPSFEERLRPIFETIEPEADELDAARERVGGPLPELMPLMTWDAYTTHRDPVLSLSAAYAVTNNPDDPDDHVHGHVTIDPRSGKALASHQLALGSEFFYPMHYGLHLHWLDLGIWVVGLAALIMLVALVSGVVIHRKLFRELFTFRPEKSGQRRVLDLHNLTGVVALPFHFMFPLTGLIIFAGLYLPVSETLLAPTAVAHARADAEAKGLPLKPAGIPAPLASVDAMVREAKRRWQARDMAGEVGSLSITHVGDANSYVSIYRAGSDRVALVGQGVHFAGTTGQVILEEPPPSVVFGINEFLAGMHLQHFEHWLLRWLYVAGGLSGCVCIGTGLVFFVGKRKARHAAQGVVGARWVDALAVAAITGMLIATLSMLVGTWLLPESLPERALWQERVFWFGWLSAFVHAAVRSAPVQRGHLAPAWREQCWAIAALAGTAVLSNWVVTGDHLLETIGSGYWPVAGLDLALLASAAVAVLAARTLRRRAQSELVQTGDTRLVGDAPPASTRTAEAARG
jgi:uncharacterized iron-regulated membrane protein